MYRRQVLAFDQGFAEVEYRGEKFQVFITYLEIGWEYLVDGKRWLDQHHRLVLAVKRWEKRRQAKR